MIDDLLGRAMNWPSVFGQGEPAMVIGGVHGDVDGADVFGAQGEDGSMSQRKPPAC